MAASNHTAPQIKILQPCVAGLNLAALFRRHQSLQPCVAGIKRTELSVVLCDDTYIADLNLEWRQKSGPTDVLSFPMGDMPPGLPVRMLGDVIISLPTAERQARERG